MARTRNVRRRVLDSSIHTEDAQMFGTKLPQFGPDVESKPQPAPVKGWNAIAPLSNMEPDFAVVLDNVVPRPGWVELRGGYSHWADNFTDEPIETLFVYRPADATEELFAAGGDTIWDVTTVDTASSAATGFTNARWQYVNFTPAGATTRLIAVNGADTAQIYDGTNWSNSTITGVDTSNLVNVNAHKRRLWFIEKDSTSAWYLATDAITGAATEFALGSLFSKGSYLVAMGTWTVDGGNGPDDLAVFISNKGQAIVYKGTDPGNNNAWFLVGTFNLPPPMGFRCLKPFGSDLLYISIEGLLPISKALPFDPSGVRSVALTNTILNAMLEAAQNARTAFGWEVELFPAQSLLFLNVPLTENAEQVQYVMNTLTGAWCRFTGWDANTFAIYNESLFFGDNNGNVAVAYTGQSDYISPIPMDIKTAFNYYDDPGRVKTINMVRPYLVIGGSVSPLLGVDVDFGNEDFQGPTSAYVQMGSLWDSATWDVSEWAASGSVVTQNNWESTGAIGTAISLRLKADIISSVISPDSVFDTALFDQAVFDAGMPAQSESGQDLPVLRLNSFQVTMEHGAAIG